MKNYYRKQIQLNEPATTIPIMEWIRDNGCPNLDHTVFYQHHVNDGMIVSLEIAGVNEDYLVNNNYPPLSEWGDFHGMKRLHEGFWWMFFIGESLYCATA